MKIAVGVLTHEIIRHCRRELFQRTLASLTPQIGAGDQLFVVDNGSTDGTAELIRDLGGTCVVHPITTCGHGMNLTIGLCAGSGADLVVFSNDDVQWHPDALEKLRAFWAEAPADLFIASGLLEEDFPWNTVRERVTLGGIDALIRDSAPGGAWTLRASDWNNIRPVPEAPGWDDVPTCERLRAKGYRVAQLDLASHLGEDRSTWGNGSKPFGRPLDHAEWGIP